ncbi:MAG: phosphoribosyltransferase [Leptolyngbyaceae cyanobacterium MO_188.B28]|nr:phosphoribosyltransferase [Leptolyngbyaceae cyanobacterium MO_188.B28]
MQFCNRTEAGRLLAQQLTAYANCENTIVLGLPRGGVPVAFEVAKLLNLPLDVCLVRKLGAPGRKELAMGAIAADGIRILNHGVVDWLDISDQIIEQITAQEKVELDRRERCYRGYRPFPKLQNCTLILVDDGVATGSTLRAAIAILKHHQPAKLVVAVPIASPSTVKELKAEVDQVVCLQTPEQLQSISLWYKDFTQTSDETVCALLNAIHFERGAVPADEVENK